MYIMFVPASIDPPTSSTQLLRDRVYSKKHLDLVSPKMCFYLQSLK